MSLPDSPSHLARVTNNVQSTSVSSASASSSSSSRSTSYVNSQGAGATSKASAISPSGQSSSSQKSVFTPAATSSSSTASASASSEDANTSVTVSTPANLAKKNAPGLDGANVTPGVTIPGKSTGNSASHQSTTVENPLSLVFQIGNEQTNVMTATNEQDIMTGYAGADTFQLSNNSSHTITDIANADVVTDFDPHEDFLQLANGLTLTELSFSATDINNDAVVDSTIIRLNQSDNILAVVLNIDLSVASIQEQANRLIVIPSGDADLSSSSSLSTSLVIDAGAGASGAAITISSSGETSSSTDSIFVPGATSSGSVSTAVATPNNNVTSTGILALAGNADKCSAVEYPIDYLIGTPSEDILVSNAGRDILIGYGGADTFVVAEGDEQGAQADVIIDFKLAEGDSIQISANIASVGSIALEPVDLDSDGVLESTSVHLPNNSVLAIVQGTIDSAGNTLLSTHMLTLAEDG
ncbi:MAG: hypothetical protein ACFB14_08605 [Leptolyngbyaceae cyanobacterium]